MNKVEAKNILDYIELNYDKFKTTQQLFDMWFDELQQYDYEDVLNKVKQMVSKSDYRMVAPKLVAITNGLTKTSKKLDWSKIITYCPRCGKAFQCDDTGYSNEYKIHRDKCRSIDYVIKQTKKWFGKDLTRAELWKMSEQEFNERYDKLLHYIHEHTDNEMEKQVIGYIFDPPKNFKF